MITIINYNMGNLGSIANMLRHIGYNSEITSDISKINSAEKIILPGVGNFDKAIQNIDKLGLTEVIKKKALIDKTPILGICLGMQLLCKNSEEGNGLGLGLIDAEVKKFLFSKEYKLKIPHMGWNNVRIVKNHSIVSNMGEDTRFYFVHSYHVTCNNEDNILTRTNYGYDFTSSYAHDNIVGVQFHPEKSHKFGMLLLNNFIQNY